MIKIEDLKIGEQRQFQIKIDEKEQKDFEELSGDQSPVHTDDKFAQTAGFEKKIAYAFHLLGYLSQFYGHYLPGGNSICLQQKAKFLRPIYLGEVITICGTVVAINQNLKIVTIKNEIFNAKGELCLLGEGIVKIIT